MVLVEYDEEPEASYYVVDDDEKKYKIDKSKNGTRESRKVQASDDVGETLQSSELKQAYEFEVADTRDAFHR